MGEQWNTPKKSWEIQSIRCAMGMPWLLKREIATKAVSVYYP